MVAALVIMSAACREADRGEHDAVNPRRVPAPAQRQFLGRPSLDGRAHTFVDMNGDLGVFDTVSGEHRILTNRTRHGGFAFESSAFSADGTRIAFAWEDVDGARELRVMTTTGADTRVVLAHAEEIAHPIDWSRDGSHILVRLAPDNGARSLALVSMPGGSTRHIAKVTAAHSTAALSSDGRHVVFDDAARDGEGERDIFIAAIDEAVQEAAQAMPLLSSGADDSGPLWTTDGRHLLFLSDRSGEPALWMVPVHNGAAAGEPVLVHRDIGRVSPSGLSPDGTLFYTRRPTAGGEAARELWALDGLLRFRRE